MGVFKDSYMEEKEFKEKMFKEGWVLDDKDLDFDNIQEEKEEDPNCVYTELDVMLNERLFRKTVVRLGKKVKKWFSTEKGKKVVTGKPGEKPHEEKIKSKEKIARRKGALRGKIKRSARKSQSKLKRRLSKLKRKIFGLK